VLGPQSDHATLLEVLLGSKHSPQLSKQHFMQIHRRIQGGPEGPWPPQILETIAMLCF